MENFATMVENMVEIAIKMNEKYVETESKLKEIQGKLSIMDTYKQVVDYIGVEEDINNIIQIITDVVIGVLGVSYCTVSLFNADDTEREIVEYKISPNISNIINDKNIESLENELKSNNGLMVINNLKDNKFLEMEEGAFLSIALSRGENFFGSIAIYYSNPESLNNSKVEFFKLIASQLELHIENAKLFAKIRMVSITDELSGLYNRMYLNEILVKNVSENKRYDIEKLAIIIADIDNFKNVNDTFGHIFGDKVIVSISNILKEIQNEYEVEAFRFGGEEFLIVAQNKTIQELEEISEKIRLSFSYIKYDIQNEKDVSFTISSGISKFGYTTKVADVGKLIEDADLGLYYSKHNGKNRYTVALGDIQLYMNSKYELEKMIERNKRSQIPYAFVTIKFSQESFELEENRKISRLIKDTFRKNDYLFNNSMGVFIAILENTKVVDTVTVRLSETLSSCGYGNFEIETQLYNESEFDIKNFFKISQ